MSHIYTHLFNADLTGLDVKASVRLASQTNLDLSTSISSVDGTTLASNDRILIKNQTQQAENGIYAYLQTPAKTFTVNLNPPPAGQSGYLLVSGEDRTGTFTNEQNRTLYIQPQDTITFMNYATASHPLFVAYNNNNYYESNGQLTQQFNTIAWEFFYIFLVQNRPNKIAQRYLECYVVFEQFCC